MNELYKTVLKEIKSNLDQASYAKKQCLQFVCDTLKEKVEHYDWVGFYLVSDKIPELLELGPFAGAPTEHTEIPFGKGVCGQAAHKKEMMVIQDVQKEDNYLACSLNVNSEIVVPIIRKDKFLGELDIDSHKKAPFTEDDKKFLQKIGQILIKKSCI